MLRVRKNSIMVDEGICVICGFPFEISSHYLTDNGEYQGLVCADCYVAGEKEFETRLKGHIKRLKEERISLINLLLCKIRY
jgi:hypothetical protein